LTTKRILSKRAVAAGAVMLLGPASRPAPPVPSSTPSSTSSTGTGGSTASSSNAPALVMESSPEETLTDNFNPFDGASPIQGMGATGLV